MAQFDRAVTQAAESEREIELTTFGRKTDKPSRRITWVYSDDGRIFIRSGRGLARDWPKNLLANGRAILHLAGRDVPVRAVHVTDIAESRRFGAVAQAKYGAEFIDVSADGEEPYPGETTTFEFLPAEE
jgi:hypothetical protein